MHYFLVKIQNKETLNEYISERRCPYLP